jgi:hypothetical protein
MAILVIINLSKNGEARQKREVEGEKIMEEKVLKRKVNLVVRYEGEERFNG